MAVYLKSPNAILDYLIDWGGQFRADIVSSSWSVSPEESGGIAVLTSEFSGTKASASMGSGLSGHVYVVTNRAMFSDGQSGERSLSVRVERGA